MREILQELKNFKVKRRDSCLICRARARSVVRGTNDWHKETASCNVKGGRNPLSGGREAVVVAKSRLEWDGWVRAGTSGGTSAVTTVRRTQARYSMSAAMTRSEAVGSE